MVVLRVLDLEDTNVKDDDVKYIVDMVPRLKFLSLRRCTKVYNLPEHLGSLNQLETLDIRNTYVAKLPKSIVKLRKLQYVRAGTSVLLVDEEPSSSARSRRPSGHVDACDGVVVPHGIRHLRAMHTLGVINLDTKHLKKNLGAKGVKAILQDLKHLTQLRKLGLSGINQRNIKMLFSAIVGHRHLESLSLQLDMDQDLHWLGRITPLKNLRRLKIYVHVDNRFQHWSSLQVLGQIRRLKTLRLHFSTDQDVELQFCDSGPDGAAWSVPDQFCELKVLEIACSSNLQVQFGEREMHQLEMLKVHCFDGSSLKLSGPKHLSSLKHVWVKGSFDDAIKEQLRQSFDQHPNKVDFKLD